MDYVISNYVISDYVISDYVISDYVISDFKCREYIGLYQAVNSARRLNSIFAQSSFR
jgi:hypothetical protein